MNIFNSLGSNYDFSTAIKILFASNDKEYSEKLKSVLQQRYKGEAEVFYKGRDALRMALRIINKKGSSVGICGFTCFAVYDSVVKEGYEPILLDIERNNLNFSFETFEKAVADNPELKVLIIQNTLGFVANIEKISKLCREKKILLIEDLAHSIGSTYENEKEAGTVGDFTILSFSQDKMIDGVTGGGLIVRNLALKNKNLTFKKLDFKAQLRDRLYPFFTFKIRKTYGLGIGKLIHFILKNLNLLSNPMDNTRPDTFSGVEEMLELPSWYCKHILDEFINIEKNLSYRREIAKVYSDNLDKRLLMSNVVAGVNNSTCLRFPIFIEKRQELISFLNKSGVYVSDIWYDAPIAPKKYMEKTDYKIGECPNSEVVASAILNLPTHRNVSLKDARQISDKINLWLKNEQNYI